MKLSQILHWGAGISNTLAVVFMVFAYTAGSQGIIFSNNQEHWFIDAGVFLGLTIALGIATLIHQNIENKT